MEYGYRMQDSPGHEKPYNYKPGSKPSNIPSDLMLSRKTYSNPIPSHARSKSEVYIKPRKPQQAELQKSPYPRMKKTFNYSSPKKNMTPSRKVYYNEQSGGFSYDDFYDSLRELNAEKDKYEPLNPRSGTITANSSPKASQKSLRPEKPPLNPVLTKNIIPARTFKERRAPKPIMPRNDSDNVPTPGFSPLKTQERTPTSDKKTKVVKNLSQSVLQGLMSKSFSRPKEKIKKLQKSDLRTSTENLDKFNLNPFKSTVTKPSPQASPRHPKIRPQESLVSKIRPQEEEKSSPSDPPSKAPDQAFRLAQKIFSRKVIRMKKRKKDINSKKIMNCKESISEFKKKYSSVPITPVSKKGFRHKKYTEKYLQNCLTHLKVIKALCVALEVDQHKTFGPLI